MRVRSEVVRRASAWLAVCVLAACDRARVGPAACPPPQGGVYATFRMPPNEMRPLEEFAVWLASPEGISSAVDAWQSHAAAGIPAGPIACAPAEWNCGWGWYFDPVAVRVIGAAMELCDGGPPHDATGCQFIIDNSGGIFCPWMAQFIELRDCRSDPTCPAMAR